MKKLASLSLRPGPDTVSRAMAWLEDLAEKQHWDARTVFKLNLCMDEALTNVVMYAFSSPPDTPLIEISAASDAKRVVLSLVDNGVAFDPTRSTPADLATSLDDAGIGGHGLRILRHYLENIEYRHVDGRNRLDLTLALDAAGPDR
jgi:anti-sigma regulatory factor (Ser/Thr protein kinase)